MLFILVLGIVSILLLGHEVKDDYKVGDIDSIIFVEVELHICHIACHCVENNYGV